LKHSLYTTKGQKEDLDTIIRS